MGRQNLAWGIALLLLASNAHGDAMDVSTNAPYTDGWATSDNGGTGFGAWTINSGANAFAFIGSSTNNGNGDTDGDGDIDVGSTSFGLAANSGATADAYRDFNTALGVGQHFQIQFDLGFVDAGGTVGLGLQNGGIGNNRFELFFVGGTNQFNVLAGDGLIDTGIAFTDEGMLVDFELTGADTYSLTLSPFEAGVSATNITGTLSGTLGSDVDRIRIFNANAGVSTDGDHDAFFNSPSIIPEPTSVSLLGLGCIAIALLRRRPLS